VLAKLDQFIFSEDVQLGDVTETFAQIAVVGPSAARPCRCARRRAADAWRRWPSTATCAARGPAAGDRHARDRHRRAGLRRVRRARAGTALTGALDAAGVVELGEATAEAIGSRRACRCSAATWTRRRFRSRRHRVARDQLHAKAATSGRKSSSACCTAATARGAQAGRLLVDGTQVPPPARDPQRRPRDRPVTSSTRSPALERADRARLRAPRLSSSRDEVTSSDAREVTRCRSCHGGLKGRRQHRQLKRRYITHISQDVARAFQARVSR
jgi:hypothetical protein